jgi:1,4-dihydroxy-2-naphthoate octaprenyltransferase
MATALLGLAGLAAVDPALRGAALGLLSAPLAWRAFRAFAAAETPAACNAVLARTGAVQAAMALCTAVGLLLL